MASSISQYEIPTTYKKQHYDTTFEITTTKTMAMPIPIVRKGEQYSIKNTAFDPTQKHLENAVKKTRRGTEFFTQITFCTFFNF